MIFAGITDVGKTRKENQDTFITYKFDSETFLLLVCDGVGGASGGKTASLLASQSVFNYISDRIIPYIGYDRLKASDNFFKDLILDSIDLANTIVYQKSVESDDLKGMSTTLVGILVYYGFAYVFNVGDSRAYLFDYKKLSQITKDHSLIQEMIDKGSYNDTDNIANYKNVITQSVGYIQTIIPNLYKIDLNIFNKFILMLCTDGLSGTVEDTEIMKILSLKCSLKKKAKLLVKQANTNSGEDNITVVLFSN